MMIGEADREGGRPQVVVADWPCVRPHERGSDRDHEHHAAGCLGVQEIGQRSDQRERARIVAVYGHGSNRREHPRAKTGS